MNFRMVFVAACLVMQFVPSVLAAEHTGTKVEKAELNGVENFSRIDETAGFAGSQIGFGGATSAAAMPSLKDEGFATVINLRLASEEGVDLEAEAEATRAAGLNYIHLPFDTDAPAADVVEKFRAVVGNEANQPVYLHCGSATRAAALWMITRVLVYDWDIDAASAEASQIAQKPEEAVAFATAYISSLEE